MKQYGVWKQKKFRGHEFLGVLRVSFLIDSEGVVAKVYETMKPALQAKKVLDDLDVFGK